ncbi:ligand-dependent nuclear receptor-interacting factor 1, partial [Silurus asotus]
LHSGTGVYYQAMPAVGPDGKNVMKLIPVKQVNGHFVHTQVPLSRNVCIPAHTSSVPLPQNRIPTLQPTADGRFILKTPLEVNTVFNSVKGPHVMGSSNALLQPSANQVHVPLITQTSLSAVQPINKAVIIPDGLPNTVKIPALPSGHYLQIPSNATVRTLPASALPTSIKNRICHSTNEPNPVKGLPMVLYVSPVSSLKLDQQSSCPTNPSEIPKTLSPAATVNVVKSSGELSRNDQGGSAPMKWVVEERAGSSGQYLIPVTSPNMSSDILKAVQQMESSRPANQVGKESVPADISKETVTPGNDNALVMCNGKVYFVAKRNSEVTKDMITNTESVPQPKKSAQSPTAALSTAGSNVTQKQDPKSLAADKKPSDVIDLCDDDDEGSACMAYASIIQPSDLVNEHDEDSNVIFVSYIPPKSSETETSKEVTETISLTDCVKDTDKSTSDTETTKTQGEVNSTCSAELDTNQCEAMHVNEPALEEKEDPAEQLEVVCGQQTDVTEKVQQLERLFNIRVQVNMQEAVISCAVVYFFSKQSFEEMVPDPIPPPKSDSELRRTFGITCDLSVSLQKIEAQEDKVKKLVNKRTIDGIRKLIHNSNVETKSKQLIKTQVPKLVKSSKRKRIERTRGKKGSGPVSMNAHLSPPSTGSIECDDATQSGSAEQSTDTQIHQNCEGAENEITSTSGADKVPDITTDVPCFSASSEPVQIHATKSESNSSACCSQLRKTPPRSSKGCGRVCTACPCGTTVGRVAANSPSKPQETPSPCSKSESSRDVNTADRLADSDASLTNNSNSSSELGKSANSGSQSEVNKDVKGTLIIKGTNQPATIGTCSSSRYTKDKTGDKSTGSQVETCVQMPPKELKSVPSSDRQLYYTTYKIPKELYSPVVLDPEEIKRQERIKRLKDLLQEKEAALEKLR